MIETNIDDMTGEIAGYAMEKLLEAGALDVFYTSIHMKKNRPAMKLTVLCREEQLKDIQKTILQETTSIGIRMYKAERICMEREIIPVDTEYGTVRVKVVQLGDIQKYAPEYEDCKKIAQMKKLALRDVYEAVIHGMQRP